MGATAAILLVCAALRGPAGATLRINEVMASNGSTIADEDGGYEDWIELANLGTEPLDLDGWGLSDDYGSPFRWVFPSVTLEPGGLLLLWASGKDRAVRPAGWWRFDEEGGTRVHDHSSGGLHGTLSGQVAFAAGPGGGGALDFAPGGRLDLDEEVLLDGDFTVA